MESAETSEVSGGRPGTVSCVTEGVAAGPMRRMKGWVP